MNPPTRRHRNSARRLETFDITWDWLRPLSLPRAGVGGGVFVVSGVGGRGGGSGGSTGGKMGLCPPKWHFLPHPPAYLPTFFELAPSSLCY